MDTNGNNRIFHLADRLTDAREWKKHLEDQLKAVKSEIEEIDRELSDAMAEAEVPNFSRSGHTFYLSTRLYASPQAGRKEEMLDALTEHGYGDLITRTVNANSLSSFVKEQREANEDEIPGWLTEVVNAYEKTSVGVRRG